MAINELIRRSVQKPGLYWFVGPTYKQAKSIGWTHLKKFLRTDPDWKFNEVELTAYNKEIDTRIELKGADNEDSLRGTGLDGLIMDECATTKPNVWPEILRPMLSDKRGWAMFIGTPKGKNWFYDIYKSRHPVYKAWKFPTSVNRYIGQEEIEAARSEMPERLFIQEFLAEFLDEASGVFRGISRCVRGGLMPPVVGRNYSMGVDLAKHEDFTVITLIDLQTKETVYFERFKDISWPIQKEKIIRVSRQYNDAIVDLDSTGVGDAIYDDLLEAGVTVRPYKFTNESKRILIEKLMVSIEQGLISFPKIDQLIFELERFSYEMTEDGRVKYSAPEGFHDDCVISLALANWGARHELYEVHKEPEKKSYEEFAHKSFDPFHPAEAEDEKSDFTGEVG